MNQILDYGGGNNDNVGKSKKNNDFGGGNFGGGNFGGGNNNNSNKNPFGGGNGGDGGKLPISDKVIKVFALIMVILAIGLIVSGVTSILKNKKEKTKEQTDTSTPTTKVTAEVTAELDEISGKVIINVTSPVVISKVKYSWDKGHENVIAGDDQKELEAETVAPYGVHVLHVQVIDEQENKTTKDFTFDSPTGVDTTQPDIVLTVVGDKLKVTVTDDTSIGYVTYTWTDEAGVEGETTTMTPEEEGMTEYEFEIDIPRGRNTVVVFAIDGSDTANVTTASKVIEAVTKPELTYAWTDEAKSVLQIQCTHEHGIKELNYTFNGVNYGWVAPEGEDWPATFLEIKSEEGENTIQFTVTSLDDTEFVWEYTWTYPDPESIQEPESDEQVYTDDSEVADGEILGSDESEYRDVEEQ